MLNKFPFQQEIPSDAEVAYSGVIFKVYRWIQPQFDGTATFYEKVRTAGSVNIIPLTNENAVLVAHQRQPGRSTFTGLIAGRIESNELALDAAKRELAEETGLAGSTWIELGAWNSYEKIEWLQHYYLAIGLHSAGEVCEDAGEQMDVIGLGVSEFCDLVIDDGFTDYIFKSWILKRILYGGTPKSFEDLFEL